MLVDQRGGKDELTNFLDSWMRVPENMNTLKGLRLDINKIYKRIVEDVTKYFINGEHSFG